MLVHDLSGGQKQRVWIAMVLAQQTNTILLDETNNILRYWSSIRSIRIIE